MSQEQIRIAIVEDDLTWQKIIIQDLNKITNFIFVASAINKAEALKIIKTFEIDCMLVDIHLSDNSTEGIEIVYEIAKTNNKIKFIMLTADKEPNLIKSAFAAGASDYIMKNNLEAIEQTINKVFFSNGTSPIDIVLKDYQLKKIEVLFNKLTSAENEVLQLILKNHKKLEIANIRKTTIDTIKSQGKSIFTKLEVNSKTELIEKYRLYMQSKEK